MVGPPPVAISTVLARTRRNCAGAHVDEQHARQAFAAFGWDQADGAMFFQAVQAAASALVPLDG